MRSWFISFFVWFTFLLSACGQAPATEQAQPTPHHVLAVETFLADIANNVAGDQHRVDSLIPIGTDPHNFEPAPSDVAKVTQSAVLIINGAGMETFLSKLLQNAGSNFLIIEASKGLNSRNPLPGEMHKAGAVPEMDPHFYLNPINVIQYVKNIRDGLSQVFPDDDSLFAQNAEAYITKLQSLDRWISEQVQQIPPEKRLLVTNHESFGYYADRYGFKIVGAVIPSVSSDASPSAQDLASLINRIKSTGAQAIFLDTGTNAQLAEQVARDSGIKVAPMLYTHSITEPGGPASTYIDMMKYDTQVIVSALR